MMVEFLPTGLKGLMVASFVAAFMSTITTHLNWGASYLMNDVYRRFINKSSTDRHYVVISQVFVFFMALFAGFAAWQLESIYGAWLLVTEIMAGTVFIILLRWYWWRVNAWSEISAMASSLFFALIFRLPTWFDAFQQYEYILDHKYYPVRFLTILVVSTIVWVVVTFKTSPVSQQHLVTFFKRVRPGGWWKPVEQHAGGVVGLQVGWLEVVSWALGVATIFLSLFGIGWLFLGSYLKGFISVSVATVCGIIMLKNIGKLDWGEDG